MNHELERMAADAICHAAQQAGQTWQQVAWSLERPSIQFRPMLSKDGNQWCALYGTNLQDGVAGFGDTPDAAMRAFDAEWLKP